MLVRQRAWVLALFVGVIVSGVLIGCRKKRNDIQDTSDDSSFDASTRSSTVVDVDSLFAANLPEYSPAIDVRIDVNPYEITGSSTAELRKRINELRPPDAYNSKKAFDAFTHWNVQWKYNYAHLGPACVLKDVRVSVSITLTAPHWQPSVGVAPSVIEPWNRYLNALVVHERGHRDRGIAAADKIYRALVEMRGDASCSALGSAADSGARATLAEFNTSDLHYDEQTAHGKTQGAVFP